MEAFRAQCLGGRAEPVNDAFDGSTIQILHGKGYIANLPLPAAEPAAAAGE